MKNPRENSYTTKHLSHNRPIDASIICFFLVALLAIPVAMLRSQTYAIGYELAKLKEEERELRQENIELESQLAALQRSIRDKYIGKKIILPSVPSANPQAREPAKLQLPEAHQIFNKENTLPVTQNKEKRR